MTVTDSAAPTTEPVAPEETATLSPPPPATGFAALLSSGDHRVVGRLFMGTSLLFLVVHGVTRLLIGAEKVDTGSLGVIGSDDVAQLFSLDAVASLFLFVVPLLLGLAIAVIPGQVGSPTVAFPRAAAAAYWTYLVGGALVVAAVIADGGPGGSDPDAVALFVAAMIVVLAALCLASVCVATTGLALRVEGMSVRRTPLFTWANVLAAGMWLITLPVLAAIMLLAYVDLRYGPALLSSPEELYLRMSWVWQQPTVYVFALPVLGAVGDIIAPAARTRFTQHRLAMGCIGAFAVFGFGVWAMPSWSLEDGLLLEYTGEPAFVGFSFLVVLPLLAFAGLVADTARKGAVRVISPLVWAGGALAMLLAAAGNGALVSIDPLDLINTTAVDAQTNYVLLATVLGAFGGVVFWAPVVWDKAVPEGPSLGLAGLGLLGTIAYCLPDLVSGFLDQPTLLGALPEGSETDAIEVLNVVSLLGFALIVLTGLGFIGLLIATSIGSGDRAPGWEGHTLEWAPGSGLDDTPQVTSEAPVYDARHAAEVAS